MSLKDAALEAAESQRKDQIKAAKAAREKSLDELIEKWEERCKWTFRGAVPECPARDEFTYARDVPHDSARSSSLAGWRVTIDEVEFLYSTSYGSSGWYVLVTCPDCDSERAVHFSGLENLGQILKAGRSMWHHCREVEAKSLAVAISRAAENANTTSRHIIELALERLTYR